MKLFIDDERFPVNDDWTIVRTSEEAIEFTKKNGIPSLISFDHDLGKDDTSIIFLNWLIDRVLDREYTIPDDFNWVIHSQNPIGAKNIENKCRDLIAIRQMLEDS